MQGPTWHLKVVVVAAVGSDPAWCAAGPALHLGRGSPLPAPAALRLSSGPQLASASAPTEQGPSPLTPPPDFPPHPSPAHLLLLQDCIQQAKGDPVETTSAAHRPAELLLPRSPRAPRNQVCCSQFREGPGHRPEDFLPQPCSACQVPTSPGAAPVLRLRCTRRTGEAWG